MNFKANPTTIGNLLSTANVKYIIPRFQREYAWELEEIRQFYNDLLENLEKEEDGTIKGVGEYFISFVVAVANSQNSSEYQLVDGQQRITTITIILSVLTHIFKELEEEGLAKMCFETYVQGLDGDARPYFKLINESPKPFFQRNIQSIDISTDYTPQTDEEKKLKDAYNFLKKNFGEKILEKKLKTGDKSYLDLLKILRDQVLNLKVIFITVDSIDDAYMIFETLNAKGKDLETIDLIKNKIFRILNEEHPTDEAADKWKEIKNILKSRRRTERISKFFRHFWISKYKFVTEAKIYQSFNKEIEEECVAYRQFIFDLEKEAKNYLKILEPLASDWPQQNEKNVFHSLEALNLFEVEQYRSLVLALLDAKQRRVIGTPKFVEIIIAIEKFHFIFTAICSSRASGLEGKYSTFSKKIRESTTKRSTTIIIEEIKDYFNSSIPGIDIFKEKFNELVYLKNDQKDKKLITYILGKFELNRRGTDELAIGNITLEHILPQSEENISERGKIGNLLPLSGAINSNIGNSDFISKKLEFQNSELFYTKEFVNENSNKLTWEVEDINNRTNQMADEAYNVIWKI